MADKEEVMFWLEHRDSGSLIPAIREFRDRAIAFFGWPAVFGENETELLNILWSQETLTASDDELLLKIDQMRWRMGHELERLSPKDQEVLDTAFRHMRENLQTMRLGARMQLCRALGRKGLDT